MYKTFQLMKHHARSILISIAAVALINTVIMALLLKFFGLSKISFPLPFPKVCHYCDGYWDHGKNARCYNDYGCRPGYRNLDQRFCVPLMKLFKIKDPVAQGVVLGGI